MTLCNLMPDALPQHLDAAPAVVPGRPLAQHLGILCAALLAPMLALASFLLVQLSTAERALHETTAREAARHIALVLDRELTVLHRGLEQLSASRSLERGQFAAFRQRAAVVPLLPGAAVLLRDQDGQVLLDTREPWAKGSDAGDPDATRTGRAAEAGPLQVSALLPATSAQPASFAAAVPVSWPDREGAYLLSLLVPVGALNDTLRREGVPEGMVATVFDQRGVVLARSAGAERYIGAPMPAEARAATRSSRDGWVRTTNVAGIPVVMAFARSDVAGWMAAASMPEAQFEQSLRRSLWASAALGVALVTLAALLASRFARRIARPIAALADTAAQDAASGGPAFATPVREVNEVGRALSTTRIAARAREREREDLLLTLDRAQVVIHDPDGRITAWTSGDERLYGWTRAEAVGRLSCELLRTELPRPLAEIKAELLAQGEWRGELRNRRRDGAEVVVASRWSLRRDADGAPVAVAESFNDITALRQAEAELRRHRDLLASVLEGSADPIFARDAEGRYVILNPPAAAAFGSTVEAALGQRAADVSAPAAAVMDGLDHEVMRTGEMRAVEHDIPAPGGERRFFRTVIAPWRDAHGRTLGVVGVSRDITLRHRAEARARAMQAELMHVSRLSAMGAMATALAHELNQPLTATANFANAAQRLLAGDPMPDAVHLENARQAMAEAAEEAVRAGRIVRHLRELVSRGDGEKRPCDLNALVDAAATLALSGMREHGVEARLRLDAGLPNALVDRVQIQQVVVNLVRNAAEAVLGAPRREIEVATSRLGAEWVEVSVADTGPGLADEVMARLFEPFVTTKRDGMGVGLSICRFIVEQHGGQLKAENNPAGGATFRVALPQPPQAVHAG